MRLTRAAPNLLRQSDPSIPNWGVTNVLAFESNRVKWSALLAWLKEASSVSEAERLIKGAGFEVNNETVKDPTSKLDLSGDGEYTVRIGKKKFLRVIVEVRPKLLQSLANYPLCDFFLRTCLQGMSDEQIEQDLKSEADQSLLQHFDEPQQMARLEQMFKQALQNFSLSREELKRKCGFNFDVYDMTGFESTRGVFRVANALSEKGFAGFAFVPGQGLADLEASKNGERWFIEVKTLVLQTKPQEIEFNGKKEILTVDKFQPNSRDIGEYVESVSRLIAGNHIRKARGQLLDTVQKLGPAKTMVALVVNLFAADFFLGVDNLREMETNLRGNGDGWEIDYLAPVDVLAFLTNALYVFPPAD